MKRITVISLAILALLATFSLNLGCGKQGGAAAISEIEQNGFKSVGYIETYHAVVEMSSSLFPQRLWEKEVWLKGPDMYKETSKDSGDESRGFTPTEGTWIFNGRTSIGGGELNIQVDYSCPPLDSYGSFDFPYDISNRLNALMEEGGIKILGAEDIRGWEAYKVEIEYRDEGLGDEASNLTRREIIWVDKTNSIVLREEQYEGDELVSVMEVLSYEVNTDIPDSFFDVDIEAMKEGKTHVEKRDEGYRDISIDEVPAYCNIVPLLPTYVPDGFERSSTGWRDPSALAFPPDLPPEQTPIWYKQFYVSYTNGSVTRIDISEAKRYDTDFPDKDSLGVQGDDTVTVKNVEMSGGRTGYYEIEMQTLYFFINDTKVRIKADLPLEELVRIAESLQQV